MRAVDISEAKAHLNKLVRYAEAGDTICITRSGKPVAKLTAIEPKRKPLDAAAMRALTDSMKTFAPTLSQDVFGSLGHAGRPKTLKEMKAGIGREVKHRRSRNRY
jgi:prevent-host-death family protein